MIARDGCVESCLVSLRSDLVGLLDDLEHATEWTGVGVLSVLIVMPKRPALVVVIVFFAHSAETNGLERIREMQFFGITIVLVEVVLVPVPELSLRYGLCQ